MKVTLYDRIGDVEPTRWDAAGHDVFSSYGMLAALEEARLPGVRMWFATLESSSGRTVAAAPITRIDIDAECLTHGMFRWLIRAVRTGYHGFLRTRLMVCGTPLSVGNPPVRVSNGVDPGPVLKQLAGAIDEMGDAQRAPWRVFKEFDATQLAPASQVLATSEHRWLLAPSEPNASLQITWSSFTAYLACLRSHYRYKIRTATHKMSQAGVAVHVTPLMDGYEDSLHQLYDAVLSRASIRFEQLTPHFFHNLGRAFGDAAQLMTFRRDGHTIGWVVLLFDRDVAYDLFHGIDYVANEETALYFNQIAEVIRLAIQRRSRRLSLGQSTDVAKARFGAQSVPLWIGLRHRSKSLTAVVRHAQRVLFPTGTVPQRHVFREMPVAADCSPRCVPARESLVTSDTSPRCASANQVAITRSKTHQLPSHPVAE